jgi:hypothetical protein
MGHAPIGIDVLTLIQGVDFDVAWQHRVDEMIDEQSGLKAFFISSEDLVRAKLAAGRLQDLADMDAIRKAAESLKPRSAKKDD